MSKAHPAVRDAIVSLLALLTLILVACGGDDPPAGNADVPEGAPRVNQDNLKFIPNELAVPVGEEVYFTNSESALHTVDVDGETVSGDMRRGAILIYTFTEPGEYAITCKYHPQMKATIVAQTPVG